MLKMVASIVKISFWAIHGLNLTNMCFPCVLLNMVPN